MQNYICSTKLQGLLERNEMRSKALGITPGAKTNSPKKTTDKENMKRDSNVRVTEVTKKPTASPRKSASSEIARVSSTKTPNKLTRTVSSKSGSDDADVAVEINITSNQNIQVSKRCLFLIELALNDIFIQG